MSGTIADADIFMEELGLNLNLQSRLKLIIVASVETDLSILS